MSPIKKKRNQPIYDLFEESNEKLLTSAFRWINKVGIYFFEAQAVSHSEAMLRMLEVDRDCRPPLWTLADVRAQSIQGRAAASLWYAVIGG